MDDAKREREPSASGSGDERESARTATTEFRIPAKVDLTRPDIPVRRPAEPEETPPEERAEDEAATEEAPAEPETEPEETKPEEAEAAPQKDPTEPAPPPTGTGPTRIERLPDLTAPQEQPAVRSSGPWTVQWDGTPPAAVAAPEAPAPEEKAEGEGGRTWLVVLAAALVLVAGLVAGQLVRPVPEPTVGLTVDPSVVFEGQAPALPWPSSGQSAVHVEGLGAMGASGGSASTPTASVAKVMTAYVYLRDHPLKPGEPGPVMTVSPQAAAEIPARERRGESILGVTADQRLTQRQALEALMVISANDVAHELARWDAGSSPAFVAKMNETARSLGMTGTRYTDPSGYDSGTVSTAADQVKLLRAAMEIPAFTEIVNKRAYEPGDGGAPRQGGNFLLGQHGVVGGKTGYTDEAGGNFVFAARKEVEGVQTLIVGAVLGQDTASAAGAVDAAQRLVVAAQEALVAKTIAPKGARVARIEDGLGDRTPLRAAAPVTVVGWPGLTVQVGMDGDPPREADAGARVTALTAGAAKVPLELVRTLDEPSVFERLTRLG